MPETNLKMQDSEDHRKGRSGWMSKRLSIWYFAILLLTTLSFGAVYTLPLAAAACLSGLLCIVCMISMPAPARTGSLYTAAALIAAALVAWIVIQASPIQFSTFSGSIWQELADAGIIGGRNSISIAPYETISAVLALTLPIFVFLIGLRLFQSDETAIAALNAIYYGGAALALFCLIQFLVLPGTLLFSVKEHYLDSFTFAYVNRNTAATSLGLLVLVAVTKVRQAWLDADGAEMIVRLVEGVPQKSVSRLRPFAGELALLAVLLLALALTKSRAGIGSTAIAAALMMILLAWNATSTQAASFNRRRSSLGKKLLKAVIYLAMVSIVIAVLAPRAILRAEIQGTEDGRFCVIGGIWSAATNTFWTGSGFGAFDHVFPAYRDPACGLRGIWDKAHNVYLEGFVGLGVIVLPILALAVVLLVAAYVAGIRQRRSLVVYPIIGLSGFVLVGLHSALDFSLQIPGMATLYAAFAALTLTIALGRGRNTRDADSASPPKSHRPTITDVAIITLVIFSSAVAVTRAKDAITYSNVRAWAAALDNDAPMDAPALLRVAQSLNGDTGFGTCDAVLVRSAITVSLAALDRIERDAEYDAWASLLQQSEALVKHGLTCMPADGNLWLRLAMLRQAAGEVPQEQATLLTLSQRYSPAEFRTLVGRLAQWNRVSSATIERVRSEVVADVRNALVYVSPNDLVATLSQPSASVLDILKEVLPLIPQTQREKLKSKGFAWAS